MPESSKTNLSSQIAHIGIHVWSVKKLVLAFTSCLPFLHFEYHRQSIRANLAIKEESEPDKHKFVFYSENVSIFPLTFLHLKSQLGNKSVTVTVYNSNCRHETIQLVTGSGSYYFKIFHKLEAPRHYDKSWNNKMETVSLPHSTKSESHSLEPHQQTAKMNEWMYEWIQRWQTRIRIPRGIWIWTRKQKPRERERLGKGKSNLLGCRYGGMGWCGVALTWLESGLGLIKDTWAELIWVGLVSFGF